MRVISLKIRKNEKQAKRCYISVLLAFSLSFSFNLTTMNP